MNSTPIQLPAQIQITNNRQIHDTYNLDRRLGGSDFSEVYKCQYNNEDYVVKIFKDAHRGENIG